MLKKRTTEKKESLPFDGQRKMKLASCCKYKWRKEELMRKKRNDGAGNFCLLQLELERFSLLTNQSPNLKLFKQPLETAMTCSELAFLKSVLMHAQSTR